MLVPASAALIPADKSPSEIRRMRAPAFRTSLINFFTDVQHWRFVTFAFSNNYAPAHRYGIHDLTHGLDSNLIGVFAIALAHCARGSNRRCLSHSQKIQRQLTLGPQLWRHLLSPLRRNH